MRLQLWAGPRLAIFECGTLFVLDLDLDCLASHALETSE